MYSSLQAILSEDKKLTVTSAPPVSEGENNSVSVTVSLPSDTDFTDTEIYLEFLCASGERFITPNLNPSLSASPVVSYLLKSGALSSSGRCYIQITLVKGDVISKSVLDENSSFGTPLCQRFGLRLRNHYPLLRIRFRSRVHVCGRRRPYAVSRRNQNTTRNLLGTDL